MISLESLLLLRQVLARQQLFVGDPSFAANASAAARAMAELDEAIAAQQNGPHLARAE